MGANEQEGFTWLLHYSLSPLTEHNTVVGAVLKWHILNSTYKNKKSNNIVSI